MVSCWTIPIAVVFTKNLRVCSIIRRVTTLFVIQFVDNYVYTISTFRLGHGHAAAAFVPFGINFHSNM